MEATDYMILEPFRNLGVVDFNDPENERKMREALEKVARGFGREYPLVIGGERIVTDEKIRSINPSNPAEVVGIVSKAKIELAERTLNFLRDSA